MAFLPLIFMAFPMCIFGVVAIFILAGLSFWIWMVIDLVQRKVDEFPNKNQNDRTMWMLIVLLGSTIGALVYYMVVYKAMGKASSSIAGQSK
ncbi:PLDc N-terminal domain-containing protein [Candidatus Dojkabacteria bacterium]|nr:PLDc N-terminal domain-containing protein [Candidatus Dojkabacteria bacterium]